MPEGSSVGLEADAGLDQVDRYGRLLRYLWRGGANVNLELVRQGAAAPYFYDGDQGRFADRLLSAAKAAKAARRGLWGACPGTLLDPFRQVETRQKDIDYLAASFRAAAATRRIPASASRRIRRISTAPTCPTTTSRSSAPIRTASTAIATASAARPELAGEEVPLEPVGGELHRPYFVLALREAVALVLEHDVLHLAPERP